jgi:hypothetical protein
MKILTHLTFSAAVIGLYTSYAAPIFLRITSGRDKLVPGPFHLGRWSTPVGTIAVTWVTFIVILLLFPPGQAIHANTMSKFSLEFSCLFLTQFCFRLRRRHNRGGLHLRFWVMGFICSQVVPRSH